MNPKRRFTAGAAVIAAAAVVVALGLLILGLSRPRAGQDVQDAAAALASRAEATNSSSPRELLSALRTGAPAGDVVRLLTTDGGTIGQPPRAGSWTTEVYPLPGRVVGVSAIELSRPGVDAGSPGFAHDAALVAAVLVLLGLMVAFGASSRAAAARETRSSDPRQTRDRGPRPVTPVQPPLSDKDRRLMVSALMLVVDTLPESPAGARATRTLGQVGVETIEPKPGVAFDPRVHCVCGVVEAPNPSLVDSVAAVVRPGYIDHGSVLREADVQIYGSTRARTGALPALS
jgi:GrpE